VRHVIGLILGILLAPAILLGLGWSSGQVSRAYAQYAFSLSDPTRFLLPLVTLLACAVVYALLVATRMSPIASFLVGLPFLALGVLAAIPYALSAVTTPWPAVTTGLLTLSVSGTALIIGLVGVIPILVPSQWRRWRARPAAGGSAGPGDDAQPAPVGGPSSPPPLAGTADPHRGPDTLRLPGAGYDGENTVNWPQNPPR
jgi:hypothetical protein